MVPRAPMPRAKLAARWCWGRRRVRPYWRAAAHVREFPTRSLADVLEVAH